MTAFSDETGELLAETKRIIACGVTDFPVYQAIALLEKFEAALSASPVETWKCAARKQSLPEPADCGWPTCGCDPYADKVIAALEEQGHAAPVAQEPVAWADPDLGKRISKLAAKLVVSGYMAGEHGVEPAAKRAERELLEFACDETQRYLEQRTPPATPAGLGADEIARVFARWKKSKNLHESLAAQSIEKELLALLSRAGDQSNSTQKDGSR